MVEADPLGLILGYIYLEREGCISMSGDRSISIVISHQ